MTRRLAAIRLVQLAVVIAVVLVVVVIVGIPDLAQLRRRFDGAGPLAPFAYALLYAVVTLSPLPKSVFTLAAGAVFGVAVGLPVVVAGATGGAVLAYYLARLLGRDAVQRLTGVSVARYDAWLARSGLQAVLVARLLPIIPFTVVNYLAGLTALRLRVLVLGTVVGILPATTAYVVLGAYGSEPGSWPFLMALGGLAALTLAGVGLGWWRRRSGAARVSAPATADGSPPPGR